MDNLFHLKRSLKSYVNRYLFDGLLSGFIRCSFVQEMYTQAGTQFRDELHRHHLPSSMVYFSFHISNVPCSFLFLLI